MKKENQTMDIYNKMTLKHNSRKTSTRVLPSGVSCSKLMAWFFITYWVFPVKAYLILQFNNYNNIQIKYLVPKILLDFFI